MMRIDEDAWHCAAGKEEHLHNSANTAIKKRHVKVTLTFTTPIAPARQAKPERYEYIVKPKTVPPSTFLSSSESAVRVMAP